MILYLQDPQLTAHPESEVHPDISSDPRISIVPLPPHPSCLQTTNKLLFLLFGPLKVFFQIACLWWALAYRTKPAKWLLVQVCAQSNVVNLARNNMLTVSLPFIEPSVNPDPRNRIHCVFLPTDQTRN